METVTILLFPISSVVNLVCTGVLVPSRSVDERVCTLWESPSIVSIPLWERYNSSSSVRVSSPSILTIRLPAVRIPVSTIDENSMMGPTLNTESPQTRETLQSLNLCNLVLTQEQRAQVRRAWQVPNLPDSVASKLEVHEVRPVLDTFDLGQLVLDEVEVVQQRVGEGRVGRGVLELVDVS